MRPLLRPALLLLALSSFAPDLAADEEWKYRFFTRIRSTATGKELPKPITAEIKIVSKIDDETFKAIVRDNDKTFLLRSKDFSKADQEYLQKWNPTFAVDLRDFPIEKVLEQSGYEVIDLKQSDMAFYVPVTLNGENLTLLVDTGAMATVIDKSVAAKLKMPVTMSNALVGGIGGGAGRAMETKFDSLEIGKVKVNGGTNSLFVIDLPHRGRGAINPDGILGFELLKHLNGMIDYKAKRLFIKP